MSKTLNTAHGPGKETNNGSTHDHRHHHVGLNLDNVETEILPCFVPLYGRLYGPIEPSFLRMGMEANKPLSNI